MRLCAIMGSSVVLLKKTLVLLHTLHEVVSLNCFTTMVYDKPPVEFESTTYALRNPVENTYKLKNIAQVVAFRIPRKGVLGCWAT